MNGKTHTWPCIQSMATACHMWCTSYQNKLSILYLLCISSEQPMDSKALHSFLPVNAWLLLKTRKTENHALFGRLSNMMRMEWNNNSVSYVLLVLLCWQFVAALRCRTHDMACESWCDTCPNSHRLFIHRLSWFNALYGASKCVCGCMCVICACEFPGTLGKIPEKVFLSYTKYPKSSLLQWSNRWLRGLHLTQHPQQVCLCAQHIHLDLHFELGCIWWCIFDWRVVSAPWKTKIHSSKQCWQEWNSMEHASSPYTHSCKQPDSHEEHVSKHFQQQKTQYAPRTIPPFFFSRHEENPTQNQRNFRKLPAPIRACMVRKAIMHLNVQRSHPSYTHARSRFPFVPSNMKSSMQKSGKIRGVSSNPSSTLCATLWSIWTCKQHLHTKRSQGGIPSFWQSALK